MLEEEEVHVGGPVGTHLWQSDKRRGLEQGGSIGGEACLSWHLAHYGSEKTKL